MIDSPISNDLFNRKLICDEIIYSIENFKCSEINEKYVVSITGEWGTGKTTIIHNVISNLKADKSRIIITEFDPWHYNDETSMLKGILKILVSKLNISRGIVENKINDFISQFITDSTLKNALDFFKMEFDDDKIINIINDKIEYENIRIVFIIDNIDRAVDNNIILLYKLINSILKLKNTVYLLSYSNEIIEKVFKSKNIDFNFIDKIVQKNVELTPITNKEMNAVFLEALSKIAKHYNFSINRVAVVIKNNNCLLFNDIRSIIIFLNNLMIFSRYNTGLDLSDYIMLKLIKNSDYELYKEIYKNANYFVTIDRHYLENYFYIDESKRVELTKKYLTELLQNESHNKYMFLVRELFSNVNSIFNGFSDFTRDVNRIHSRRSIESGKYFQLYFSFNFSENQYFIANMKVDNFIGYLNQNNPIDIEFLKLLSLYDETDHGEIIYLIKNHFEKLNHTVQIKFIKFLCENLDMFDETNEARNVLLMASDLIYSYIGKSSADDFEEIKLSFLSIKNLYIIRKVIMFYERGYDILKPNNNFEKLVTQFEELKERIINDYISIYIEENYHQYNIRVFEYSKLNKYLIRIISEKNVILFLKDFVGVIIDSNYSYYLDKKEICECLSPQDLKDIVNKLNYDDLTDSDKFILDLFNITDFSDLNYRDSFDRTDVIKREKRIKL